MSIDAIEGFLLRHPRCDNMEQNWDIMPHVQTFRQLAFTRYIKMMEYINQSLREVGAGPPRIPLRTGAYE